MRSPRHATILGLLLSAGCSSLPDSRPAGVQEPDPMEKAFQVRENFKGGGGWDIPSDRHLATIDEDSQVVITPDRLELQGLAGQPGQASVLPPRTTDEEIRLDTIPGFLAAAQRYLDEASRVNRLLQGETDRQVRRELIQQQGKLGLAVVSQINELAMERAQRLHPGDDADSLAAMKAEFKRLTDPLFRDEQGKRVLLNVKNLETFLEQEIRFAQDAIGRDQRAADRHGSVSLRMIARLRSKGVEDSVRVGITGYDDIEAPNPLKQPRIGLAVSEADQARLQKGYQLASGIKNFIDDAQSNDSQTRAGIRGMWDALKKDLDAIKTDQLQGEALTRLTGWITASSTWLKEHPGSDESEKEKRAGLAKDLTALKGFVTKLEIWHAGLKQDLTTFRTTLQSGGEESFFSTLLVLPSQVEALVNTTLELAGMVPAIPQQFASLLEVLKARATDDATIQSLIDEEFAGTKTAVEQFEATLEQFSGLMPLFRSIVNAVQTKHVAEELWDEGGEAFKIPIEKANSGTIDLSSWPTKDGDVLKLRTELIVAQPGGEKVIPYTKNFEVRRLGLSSRWSVPMVFVDRIGMGSPGDPEVQYDPAPSVSWTLHYRVRAEPQGDWGSHLWSTLDPGIGINAATVDFEDESRQIGLGLHLSLFNDLIVFGYGYNLNASKDNGYRYVGIGLLELLDTVGVTF